MPLSCWLAKTKESIKTSNDNILGQHTNLFMLKRLDRLFPLQVLEKYYCQKLFSHSTAPGGATLKKTLKGQRKLTIEFSVLNKNSNNVHHYADIPKSVIWGKTKKKRELFPPIQVVFRFCMDTV